MQRWTDQRKLDRASMTDELWLLEHPPVFTQGQSGKPEHILQPGDIPIVHTDRGGQVTYHAPGQLVAYVLLDLTQLGYGIRQLVCQLETVVIELLSGYGITANGDRDAPGVYVNGAKICSIGLRVRRGCSYHGIALNVAMDLEPFQRINPCGYPNLSVTQISDLIEDQNIDSLVGNTRQQIISTFTRVFGYNEPQVTTALPEVFNNESI